MINDKTTNELNQDSVDILLVEDNPGDVRLITEYLKKSSSHYRIHVATDGEKALAYLRKEGEYTKSTRPDIILLDLNLPKMDGRAVLEQVKSDPQLKQIPVVVLTSSKAAQDISKTYGLNANAYMVKPVGLDQFMASMKTLKDFWLKIAKLPKD